MYSVRTPSLLGFSLMLLPLLSGCSSSRYAEEHDYERYQRHERRAQSRTASEDWRQSRSSGASRGEPARKVAEQAPRRPAQTAAVRAEPARQTAASAEPTKAKSATTEVTPKEAAPAAPATIAKPASSPAATPGAATPSATAAKPVDEAAQKTAKKQLEDGYRLLRAGFVKKARERFDLAMNAYAAEASLAQGRSMDPSYLKTVAFPDVKPEAEEARRLYRRAIMLGNNEAKGDLERLEKALAAAEPVPAPAASATQPESPEKPQKQ